MKKCSVRSLAFTLACAIVGLGLQWQQILVTFTDQRQPELRCNSTQVSEFRGSDEAYAFMLYGDFAASTIKLIDCCQGFLVAVYTIRKFDQRRPILLLSTGPPIEERELLDRLGVETRKISIVRGPKACRESIERQKLRLLDSFTKLRVWELTEFRTVLYIEFDTLIRCPVDLLFEKFRSIAGANALGVAPMGGDACERDWSPWPGIIRGNTGIMLIRPSIDFALKYEHAVANANYSCSVGSQDLENMLFNRVFSTEPSSTSKTMCIPTRYFNCKVSPCLANAFIVHWTGERKPWDGPSGWPEAYPLWNATWNDALKNFSNIL